MIRAYETDPLLPHRAVLLLGPFMPVEQRLAFQARVERDPRLQAITFEARVEAFFQQARAVVAMGGYNTFCEILSFGKPALLVPRTTPRLEQYLRAERAQALGLVRMLPDDGYRARRPDGRRAALPARHAGAARRGAGADAPGAGADRQVGRTLAGPRPRRRRSAPHALRLTVLPPRVAILVKGYPRLSETFIAQEILALERRGLALEIVSLRHPTDGRSHPLHAAIRAPVRYLPEYLYQEPWRVLRSLARVIGRRGFWRLLRVWLGDLVRDFTANRGRRLGQAWVLAAELPATIDWLHVHYLHTPASVARYAAILRGLPFSISAHAKDVWTIPAWEKREKIADARWLVTCSRMNLDHLRTLAPGADLELVYHGLEAARFPAPARASTADGRDAAQPVGIVCVARAVEKKGLDVLIEALALLPADLALALRACRRRRAHGRPDGARPGAGAGGARGLARCAARRRRWWRPCAGPICSASRHGWRRTATATGCPT